MKVYIFSRVDELTNNYHKAGALVIVANDDDHAKAMIEEVNATNYDPHAGPSIHMTEKEWDNRRVLRLADDSRAEPELFVFEDAGCC